MASPLPHKNELTHAASPYLRQHRDNPVWWQEWSEETLAVAREHRRPLFVSVGYATCHWCHVMAQEAFSDPTVASALNESFVAVKVDREERPDIDHYLMQFLLASRGHGGWPLNVFLTPELKPMLALTYVPLQARGGMPGFVEILGKVVDFYRTRGDDLPEFNLWDAQEPAQPTTPGPAAFRHRLDNLVRRSDPEMGGFGTGAKFPPHTSLLYLLFGVHVYRHAGAARVARRTLDVMARRGLHDHLQGGFFRYCVDRSWTVPHFEKMLYDQAMAIWVYALSYQVFGVEGYRRVAERAVTCLEETFRRNDGLYASAHDADTDHQEGATYLWNSEELEQIAGAEVFEVYDLEPGAQVEGSYHLVLRDPPPSEEVSRRVRSALLDRRRKRRQPERDEKALTAWNALAAVALLVAGRAFHRSDLKDRAHDLYHRLEEHNRDSHGNWVRSTLDGDGARPGVPQFLGDYAAILLLETYLAEESTTAEDISAWQTQLTATSGALRTFQTGQGWSSARGSDFPAVPADDFDSPSPSPVTLAEFALQRSALLTDAVEAPVELRQEVMSDFGNLASALAAGEWYFLQGPSHPDWAAVPMNVVYRWNPHSSWCYRGLCRAGEGPDLWNPAVEASG